MKVKHDCIKLYFVAAILVFLFLISGISSARADIMPGYRGLSAGAFPERAGVLSLRSQDGHNGEFSWQFISLKDAGADGAVVSKPGTVIDGAMPAIVPGTVLNTMVFNNIYPEPYFGLNNARESKLIPDITDIGPDHYTGWFCTEFELSNDYAGKRAIMEFKGINYRAEIWLNGHKLGDMAGMFKRGFFDITDNLSAGGKNKLAVLVRPVDVPGGFRNKFKEVRAAGENKNGGDGQIGRNTTMLMSVGWDFTFSDGIRDRNTGIWKDINIFAVSDLELRDDFMVSKLAMPTMDSCQQELTVSVINHSGKEHNASLRLTIPDMKVDITSPLAVKAGETKEVKLSPADFAALIYNDPKIWWPLGKGDQPLYNYTLKVESPEGVCLDEIQGRFAVRSIVSDRNTPDKSRRFVVNGRELFLHGTNWIPEAMLRTSDKRTLAQLRYTAQAGINFIRFWAGGIVEDEYFYDLCDELGLMVSMEFWQTGDTVLPDDKDLYRECFADTIKLLRNHPSLIYYISANERGINNVVPVTDILAELDPTRQWQTGSETDGIGDGSPYKYVNPMFYYDDTASERGSRFHGMCPEYGTACLPNIEGLRKMMAEKDIWPVNKVVWDYLDGGAFHDMVTRYVPAIEQYGQPESLEQFARQGQAVGGLAYRSMWECWNRQRGYNGNKYTSGVWFWYNNSPIPQVCGRMWDWYLDPTAALYFSQDAHEPIHAQFDFITNTVSVNNELYEPFNGFVRARIFDLEMNVKVDETVAFSVNPDVVAGDILALTLPADISPVHFIRLDISNAAGTPVADTFYWCSNQKYEGKRSYSGPLYGNLAALNQLPKTTVVSRVDQVNGQFVLHLKNTGEALAFMLRVKLCHAGSDESVPATYYSDNYFSLLPGEEKTVIIESLENIENPSIIIDGWNTPLTDLLP